MVQAEIATRSRELINLARSCPREISSRSRRDLVVISGLHPPITASHRHGAGGAPRAARETEMRSHPGDAISPPEMRSASRLARPAADLGSAAGAAASADVLGGGDRLRAVLATRRLRPPAGLLAHRRVVRHALHHVLTVLAVLLVLPRVRARARARVRVRVRVRVRLPLGLPGGKGERARVRGGEGERVSGPWRRSGRSTVRVRGAGARPRQRRRGGAGAEGRCGP